MEMLDQLVAVPASTRAPVRVLNAPLDAEAVLVYNNGTVTILVGERQDSVALPISSGSAITWKGQHLWAVSAGAAGTLYLSQSADFSQLGTVNVTAGPGGLSVNSTAVGVTTVAGAVNSTPVGTTTIAGTVNSTPVGNTPVSGQALSSTIAGGALSTVVASASYSSSGSIGITNVILAGTKQIELHNASLWVSAGNGNSLVTTSTLTLIRSDTAADISLPVSVSNTIPGSAAPPTVVVISKDFQGVLLPLGVNVQMKLVGVPTAQVCAVTVKADVNYTLVGP